VALRLFSEQGFDATTIEDVAEAAGISRRTFFNYFPTKNDLVWGDFEGRLVVFRALLDDRDHVPMMDALRESVVEFNAVPPQVVASHRRRMRLILEVPALQAYSTLKFASWRAVVAEFAARRVGQDRTDMLPRHLGHLALATSLTAYEQWLASDDDGLADLLETAFSRLSRGFTDVGR
jgi:mycofactocin system transcriptional regulator